MTDNKEINQQDMPKSAFGFAFGPTQQSKPGLTFCGSLPIPTSQSVNTTTPTTRHSETGQPIPTSSFAFGMSSNNITNNRCFPVPQNIGDDMQDKKKILDKLYSELHSLRCEIDKLNKSVDTIYDIMRHL